MTAGDETMSGHTPQQTPQSSPYGSPHAQAQPSVLPGFQAAALTPQGTGLAEMADMVRMAATAAAAAAEATQASTASGDRKKDRYRLIPKPATFGPTDREQEVSQWKDWYWSLRQYLLVIDGKYEDDLNYVERSDTEVDWDLLDTEEQHRGRFMYSLLSTLLQGRLLSLIRSVDKSNELEALWQLLLNCQPRARNRTMAMLQRLDGLCFVQHEGLDHGTGFEVGREFQSIREDGRQDD